MTSTESGIVVRTVRPEEWQSVQSLDALAFAFEAPPDYMEDLARPELEFDRFTGAYDPAEDRLIGTGAILSKQLTFPRRGPSPVAAVTWVSVNPAYRRRGILRRLMRHQLHGLHGQGREPVAILTASEAAIYGRFGYGQAAGRVRIEVPSKSALLSRIPAEQVREMRREDALPIIRSIYERVAPHVTGHLSRSTPTWNHLYSDHALDRRQASSLRFAVHPDGYASFRVQLSSTDRGADSTVQVKEICAATPQARVSLWRYLLGLDLMARVQLGRGWPDDPVLDMLENTRAVLSGSGDHLWLRIVDLPRAIDTRGYAADVDVIVRITDDFCPWNAGTHRLRLRPDGGSCVPAPNSEPEVQLDIADLAAAFLGGTVITRLAMAGRALGSERGLARLDAALRTGLGPYCPEVF